MIDQNFDPIFDTIYHGYGLRNCQVAAFMKLAGKQTAQLPIYNTLFE